MRKGRHNDFFLGADQTWVPLAHVRRKRANRWPFSAHLKAACDKKNTSLSFIRTEPSLRSSVAALRTVGACAARTRAQELLPHV